MEHQEVAREGEAGPASPGREPIGPAEPVTAPIEGTELGEPAELEDPWPARSAAGGLRLRLPTAVLLALLVAAGAFWGGAAVQRDDGSAASSGALAFAAIASRLGATAGRTSSGKSSSSAFGFPGASSSSASGAAGATTGTVTDLSGRTLYVTTTSGSLVEVKLGSQTTITRDATSAAASLKPGDTVVVEGSTKDGTLEATSIAATQEGVTSTAASGLAGAAGNSSGSGATRAASGKGSELPARAAGAAKGG